MLHLRFELAALGVALGMFAGVMLFIELGRRLGARQMSRRPDEAVSTPTGASVVYALLSLLIGFTFNGAAARFDSRRQLVIQEINAAGTAWERIETLPDSLQEPVRVDFRRFLDAVISPDTSTMSKATALNASADITRAQSDVWKRSVALCLLPEGDRARMLLLPGLNDMFGAVEKERLARRVHPPPVIFFMLALAAFAGALFLGYGTAASPRRSWFPIIGVAATIGIATFIIFELEYPRLGLIRLDEMDRALVEFRTTLR